MRELGKLSVTSRDVARRRTLRTVAVDEDILERVANTRTSTREMFSPEYDQLLHLYHLPSYLPFHSMIDPEGHSERKNALCHKWISVHITIMSSMKTILIKFMSQCHHERNTLPGLYLISTVK